MKFLAKTCLILGLSVATGTAQSDSQVQDIKKELQLMQERFQKSQEEHQRQLLDLQKKIEELQSRPAVVSSPPPPVAETSAPTRAWSPTDPIRVGKGSAFMDIGLVGTFAVGGSTADDIQGGTQLGGHDPNQRGFTVQGIEASFRGAVDPYFRANAQILFGLDPDSEGYVEVEEAWMETVSLPANLQLRGGQLMTDFGRLNTQHPHTWAFVDSSLVLARFLGEDGLRNPGARISWLAPTPFYSELFLTVQNSGGSATSFRGAGHHHGEEEEEELPFAYRHADNDRGVHSPNDMLFTPRYATSFDLTDNQVLLLGASAAFGPNSSGGQGDTSTRIYGLDFTWKWKSPTQHAGFPFVSVQAEALLREYKAGAFDWADEENPIVDINDDPAVLGAEKLTDYGFYAQVLYGFRKGWVAGVRADWVGGDRASYEDGGLFWNGEELGRDEQRNKRWRLSPNLTWYPSEFSKIRLQYNYDDRSDIGVDHSVWLQFEFLLGAHGAHTF